MSATAPEAAMPTPVLRNAPSFLASVRRLLWDAGHRSSCASSPSSSVLGRKRPLDDQDGAGGASSDGNNDIRGLTGTGGSPPHLALSGRKMTTRRQQRAALAVSLVSSDDESSTDDGKPAAKRAKTASGWFATALSPKAASPPTASTTPSGRPRVINDYPFSLCSPCEEDDHPHPREESSLLLSMLPPEVISSDVLSFLPTSADRRSLQLTCRQFKSVTDSQYFLARLDIGGAGVEGKRGIILEGDTPRDVVRKLLPFSRSGNMQSIYMLGMLKAYCFDAPKHGIALLRMCASQGYVRASYALGLILRDSSREDSRYWLAQAARGDYIPAWQEILPAAEVKARFGDLDADRLRCFLDFPCLNRLLGRHYVDANPRCVQTSHCWNPLCGRWAYKATPSVDRYLRRREARTRRRAAERREQQAQAQAARDNGNDGQQGGGGEEGDDVPNPEDPEESFATCSVHALLRSEARIDGGNSGNSGSASPFPLSIPVPATATRRTLDPANVVPGEQQDEDGGAAPPPQPPAAAAANAPVAADGAPDDAVAVPANNNNNNPNANAAAAADNAADDTDADSDDDWVMRVSRMKMCSSCRRAKYCSKLCQVYDWRSGRHKTECHYLN